MKRRKRVKGGVPVRRSSRLSGNTETSAATKEDNVGPSLDTTATPTEADAALPPTETNFITEDVSQSSPVEIQQGEVTSPMLPPKKLEEKCRQELEGPFKIMRLYTITGNLTTGYVRKSLEENTTNIASKEISPSHLQSMSNSTPKPNGSAAGRARANKRRIVIKSEWDCPMTKENSLTNQSTPPE